MRIALQALLNRQSQTLHAAAHVGVAGGDPDPDAARYRDHRRLRTSRTRPNASASTFSSTLTRLPPPSSISIRPRRFRDGIATGASSRSAAFGRCRGELNRDKLRSRRNDTRQASPPPPREHQTRRNAVSPRDLRHHRAGRQRLFDDPHLIVARPAAATLNPAQNLYPHLPTLRLALKLDLRQ